MAARYPSRPPEHHPEHGFVLVATLWILAALSALVIVFSYYVSSSARALHLDDASVENDALVSAAVELTAYQILLSKDDARPAEGAFRIRLGGDELDVSFLTEGARIDLNAAPKALLANLFATLGAPADAAQEYADRVVAWRTTPAAASAAQSEEALYAAAGRNYAPRLAPFAHADELALVVGPPPALVERALPFLTVFSGAPGVDVLTAAPEVIAALPGMTPLVLKEFLGSRAELPRDPAVIAQALGPAGESASIPKSKAWRVRVVVNSAQGWRRTSTVVIAPDGGDEPYRVLSWQHEVPQSGGAARPLRSS